MFNIDFFELLFLAEACIPPVPIARYSFFDNLHRQYYRNMNEAQRKQMFDFIIKNPKFDIKEENCLNFYNRFNPENQFRLKVEFDGQIEYQDTYFHEGKYHVSKNQWIHSDFIVSGNCA